VNSTFFYLGGDIEHYLKNIFYKLVVEYNCMKIDYQLASGVYMYSVAKFACLTFERLALFQYMASYIERAMNRTFFVT